MSNDERPTTSGGCHPALGKQDLPSPGDHTWSAARSPVPCCIRALPAQTVVVERARW